MRLISSLMLCFMLSHIYTQQAFAFGLYFSDAHPYMAHRDDEKGFLTELVINAGQRINIDIDPKYVPWKRAQAITKQGTNNLIIAVRSLKRESNYKWLSPLFNMQTVIVTTQLKINTLEEAIEKLENLSVMPGIALKGAVITQGYPKDRLLTLPINKRLISFLKVRKKTGWIAQKKQIESFWHEYGKGVPLIIGDVIEERTLWLACSKDCNEIPTDKLIKSLKKLQTSKWYETRKVHYLGNNK